MAEFHALTDQVRRPKRTRGAPITAVPSPASGWLELQRSIGNQAVRQLVESWRGQPATVQRRVEPGKLNVVGEWHDISEARHKEEKKRLSEAPYAFDEQSYWDELDFTYGQDNAPGDSPVLRMVHRALNLFSYLGSIRAAVKVIDSHEAGALPKALADLRDMLTQVTIKEGAELRQEMRRVENVQPDHDLINSVNQALNALGTGLGEYLERIGTLKTKYERINLMAQGDEIDEQLGEKIGEEVQEANDERDQLASSLGELLDGAQVDLEAGLFDAGYDATEGVEELDARVMAERSEQMHEAAQQAATAGKRGVWKVGNEHVKDLLNLEEARAYTLTLEDDFNEQFGFPKTEKEKG